MTAGTLRPIFHPTPGSSRPYPHTFYRPEGRTAADHGHNRIVVTCWKMEVQLLVHSIDVCDHGVRQLTLESLPGSGDPPVAVVDVPGSMRELGVGDAVRLRIEPYSEAVHGGGLALGEGLERGDLDEVGADAEPAARSSPSATLCGPVVSSSEVSGAWAVLASAGGFRMLLVSDESIWGSGGPPAEGGRLVWSVEGKSG